MIDDALVAAAREVLLGGGVAVIPTDTVYGLAAALDEPAGVEALYRMKGRLRSQPCQVLLFDPDELAAAFAGMPPGAAYAARALLPGPVTCIVPDSHGRFAPAAGDRPGSVGLRAPRGPGALAGLGLPLIATSANAAGEPPPGSIAGVDAALRAGADIVIDDGPLPGTSSAVVDLLGIDDGDPAALVRPGPDPEAVRAALSGSGVDLL